MEIQRGNGRSPAVHACSTCPTISASSPVCIRQTHPLQTMATYVSIGTGAYGQRLDSLSLLRAAHIQPKRLIKVLKSFIQQGGSVQIGRTYGTDHVR